MILREINVNELNKLLTEDQESDSIRKAIALYMNRMGCSKQEADKFVRIKLREDLPNLRYKKEGKFILGVTRMFLNRELVDTNIVQRLDTTLPYIASEAHINEYDKNLNGMSAVDIINRFADAVKQDAEKDKERLAQKQFQKNNNYDIVKVDTFEDTSKYRQYCYPEDRWCITKYPHMLDSYTSNGVGQFYFCLKKGFENMQPIQGENCPLDEYGLSMIAVCVDGNGRLKTATCRWNHSNGGSDKILTTDQISEIIGCNFYDVFKPNNKFQEKVEEIKKRLAEKESITEIFDRIMKLDINGKIYRVMLGGDFNVVKYNENTHCYELVSNEWFDYIQISIGDNAKFVKAHKNGKEFFVSLSDGKSYTYEEITNNALKEIEKRFNEGNTNIDDLVEDKRRTWCGFYKIRLLGRYTLLDEEGKLLLPKLYEDVDILTVGYKISEGYYFVITEDGRSTLLDSNLNDVLGKSYLRIGSTISNEMTISVKDEEGWNVISITENGEKLCKRSFETWCTYLGTKNGERYFDGIDGNRQSNLYTSNGEAVCKTMTFDTISSFYTNDYVYVSKDKKENLLSVTGELLSDEWYDRFERTYFVGETRPFVKIKNDGQESFFNVITKTPINMWFDEVMEFSYGENTTKVRKGDKVNMLSTEGKLIMDKWFDDVEHGCYDCMIVTLNNKKNIWHNNSYVLDEWVDDIQVTYSYIHVTNGENEYSLNTYDTLHGRLS